MPRFGPKGTPRASRLGSSSQVSMPNFTRGRLKPAAEVRRSTALDGGRLVLRMKPGQEFCEIAHLLVTVLDEAFARGIWKESASRFCVRSEFWRIEVSQPEAAAHFTAIVCVSAEMNEVTCPDRRAQRAHACAHGSCHTGFRESRHV